MTALTIYTTSWCPSCVNAKAFLEANDISYTELDIEDWDDPRGRLEEITGRRTVPQIMVGDTLIGGCEGLLALHHDGVLAELLTASA